MADQRDNTETGKQSEGERLAIEAYRNLHQVEFGFNPPNPTLEEARDFLENANAQDLEVKAQLAKLERGLKDIEEKQQLKKDELQKEEHDKSEQLKKDQLAKQDRDKQERLKKDQLQKQQQLKDDQLKKNQLAKQDRDKQDLLKKDQLQKQQLQKQEQQKKQQLLDAALDNARTALEDAHEIASQQDGRVAEISQTYLIRAHTELHTLARIQEAALNQEKTIETDKQPEQKLADLDRAEKDRLIDEAIQTRKDREEQERRRAAFDTQEEAKDKLRKQSLTKADHEPAPKKEFRVFRDAQQERQHDKARDKDQSRE